MPDSHKAVNVYGATQVEDVESAIELAKEDMDKENPTDGEAAWTLARAYIGKL